MKQPGILYVCDRQPKAHCDGKRTEVFVGENDEKSSQDWREIAWTDANGVARVMLICPECARKYASIEATQQRDMAEFDNEGMR